MYDLIKGILATAAEEDVDISVGYDKYAVKVGYTDELKEAYQFLKENYFEIVELHNAGKEDELKAFCG